MLPLFFLLRTKEQKKNDFLRKKKNLFLRVVFFHFIKNTREHILCEVIEADSRQGTIKDTQHVDTNTDMPTKLSIKIKRMEFYAIEHIYSPSHVMSYTLNYKIYAYKIWSARFAAQNQKNQVRKRRKNKIMCKYLTQHIFFYYVWNWIARASGVLSGPVVCFSVATNAFFCSTISHCLVHFFFLNFSETLYMFEME